MTTENTAEIVLRWAEEMGLHVPDDPFQLQEFQDALNNPAMKGAWLHLVQHVRPKQKIEKINRVLADYEFLKTYPVDKEVKVSIHKPEDVILFKKQEKVNQLLIEKRKEEAMLDEEIRQAQKLLKDKQLLKLSLQKTVKNKEQKTNALKLKFEETKQGVTKMSEANAQINSILNCKNEESNMATALILIKQSIKQLMSSNQQTVDQDSEFWTAMREELLCQPPTAIIQAVLSLCQDLCASIDALVYNQCEPQAVADFSPAETEIATLRSELEQTQAECEKAETLSREHSNAIENLFEDITQLLMKDDSNADIGRIKSERIRESLEHENRAAQLEYVNKYLTDMETNNEGLESDESTLHNRSLDQKEKVQNTILHMESQAQSIRDHVAEFQNLSQVFANLKSAQDESLEFFKESIDKLASLKVHAFQNKLVQVHTMLVQISDDCYSNNIDKFPVESGSVDFKQIHHSLSCLSALKQIKPLPDVTIDQGIEENGITPCKLPHSLSEEALEEIHSKLQELKAMFRSLS